MLKVRFLAMCSMSRFPDNDLEFFVNIWNELFLASMFIFSDEKITVPVALNPFISKAGISWDVLSAGLVLSLLPTMIVLAFAQPCVRRCFPAHCILCFFLLPSAKWLLNGHKVLCCALLLLILNPRLSLTHSSAFALP